MLGVDIGNYSIKVSLIKGSAKKPRLENWSYDVLPINFRGGNIDSLSLKKIVSQLIKKVSAKEKVIAVNIPSSEAIFRTLSLDDSLKGDLLEGEIQLELVNFIPFPLGQASFDYSVLGPSEGYNGKQEVFVVASRQDLVNKSLSSVESKSIKAKKKIVDVDTFALSKLMEICRELEDDVVAILDVGYQTSRLAVFDRKKLIFTREISIGGHNLTELIAEIHETSIDNAEEIKKNSISEVSETLISGYMDSIGEQVVLSIDAYHSGQSAYSGQLTKLFLTGGGSTLAGFLEMLGENIEGVELSMLNMNNTIDVTAKAKEELSDYASNALVVAAGLGIRRTK